MSEERVRVEVDEHVATVCLARGEQHNALDAPMFDQLDTAIRELRQRGDVRAIVLHGEGPSFCAGLDFASVAALEKSHRARLVARAADDTANLVQRVSVGWLELPMPVIAALHGHVLGGGLQIALGADIRIAAPDIRLSIMESIYGLVPDMGITRTLPPLVRLDVAKELTWSARTVSADEALRLGLVTRVENDPLAAALELAAVVASRSPDAIRAAKQLLNQAWQSAANGLLALESQMQSHLKGSPNQLAALEAARTKHIASFVDPEPFVDLSR